MFTRRKRALLTFTVAASLAVPAASAPAGMPGKIVQDLGSTAGPPSGGGAVTSVSGDVGGIVTGVGSTVSGSVDSVVGGVLAGSNPQNLLPAPTLDDLLATLGSGTGTTGSTGGSGSGAVGTPGSGATNTGPGSVMIDAAGPHARVRRITTLRDLYTRGILMLEIRTDEPSVVAVAGAIRPGHAIKSKSRSSKRKSQGSTRKARSAAKRSKRAGKPARHSRKLIKFGAAVLAFRRPGALKVTVKVGRQARATLRRSRDARMSLALVAADVARNQSSSIAKQRLPR